MKYLMILIVFTGLAGVPSFAWDIGQQWPSTIHYSFNHPEPTLICGTMDVSGSGLAEGFWTYQGIQNILHPVSGVPMEAHEFYFSGDGSGSADIISDSDCEGYAYWEQPVTIRLHLETEHLNPVGIHLKTSTDGVWHWFIIGCPEYIDSCSGDLSIDHGYDPYHADFDWPLEEGKTWQLDMVTDRTVDGYWYGWVGDFGEYPISLDDSSVESASISSEVFPMTDIHGCLSYPVHHSSGVQSSWCPVSDWYSQRLGPDIGWDVILPAPPTPPVSTPSPPPSTPSPPVDTQTPSPAPSSMPDACHETGVSIRMSSVYYTRDYPCRADAVVCNTDLEPLTGYHLFVLLEVAGIYLFAPDYTENPAPFADASRTYDHGMTEMELLPDFKWPSTSGEGAATWYGALVNPDLTAIHGTMGQQGFFWSE